MLEIYDVTHRMTSQPGVAKVLDILLASQFVVMNVHVGVLERYNYCVRKGDTHIHVLDALPKLTPAVKSLAHKDECQERRVLFIF